MTQSINNRDDDEIEYQPLQLCPWEGWEFDDNGKIIGYKREQTMTLAEAKKIYE